MNGPRRLIITGVAAAGVLVTGGVAVATGLAAASASSTSSAQPSVADLRARLAQLQSDTSSLSSQVIAAQQAVTDAEAARALAEAQAAAAAVAAANVRPSAPQYVAPTHAVVQAAHTAVVTKKHPAPRTTRSTTPAPHTYTGASGSTGGDDSKNDSKEPGDD